MLYGSMLAGNASWTDPDTGAMFPLQVVTVGAAGASSVTFTNIPNTYAHLQIRYLGRSSQSATETGLNLRLNGDTGSNYAAHYIFGDGASASSGANTSQTSVNMLNISGASATANSFAVGVIDVLDYASTNKNKTIRQLMGWDGNGSGRVALTSGLWFATPAAVTSVNLYPSSGSFAQYSQFALYGVKSA